MYIVVILIVLAVVLFWWLRSERALSRNERAYLKRRGYHFEEEEAHGPAPSSDARLFSLIESLGDLSPYSWQRAAEDLARMCKEGRGDPRMLSSLVSTLDDSDASVRSAAASALGHLGDARAIDALERRAELEESIHVRAALQKALEMLGRGLTQKNAN